MATHDLTLKPTTHRVHALKSWPQFFEHCWAGTKMFEIRLNDRNFTVGDEVILHEFDPATKWYSGRRLSRRIVYLTDYLQKEGYVVLQLAP